MSTEPQPPKTIEHIRAEIASRLLEQNLHLLIDECARLSKDNDTLRAKLDAQAKEK